MGEFAAEAGETGEPQTADGSTKMLDQIQLEVTRRCQQRCGHCYATSGPSGAHGLMGTSDWNAVVADATKLGAPLVQMIGGEPTTCPDLPELIEYTLDVGLKVEVYSNLYRVTSRMWRAFERPGVGVATSYYSDDAGEHDAITGVIGSHARTRSNIVEAVRRGIPIRAGVVRVRDGQRVDQARAELTALGVTRIKVDRVRRVGRAQHTPRHDVGELCGRCARGRVAVSPDGVVWPCGMARWMPLGSVRVRPLAEILAGPAMERVRARIPVPTVSLSGDCNPDKDGTDCEPAETEACGPKY